MATIYLLEAANLFIGDEDPTGSNHLELEELKLPAPSYKTADHVGGGGIMDVAWGMNQIEKLEPTFKLKGFNPDRLTRFMAQRQTFTARGVIRNKRSGTAQAAVAVIEGIIGKIDPEAFKRGDAMGHEYALHEIVSYRLVIDNRELFSVDVFTNVVRIDGVDRFADVNRILAIPGAV